MVGKAEALEVEFIRFSASEILFDDKDKVVGVATCDMGRLRWIKGPNFEQGIDYTQNKQFFEGCEAFGKTLINKFKLDAHSSPQTYGIGLKNYGR